jgi:hypothetical protein
MELLAKVLEAHGGMDRWSAEEKTKAFWLKRCLSGFRS